MTQPLAHNEAVDIDGRSFTPCRVCGEPADPRTLLCSPCAEHEIPVDEDSDV